MLSKKNIKKYKRDKKTKKTKRDKRDKKYQTVGGAPWRTSKTTPATTDLMEQQIPSSPDPLPNCCSGKISSYNKAEIRDIPILKQYLSEKIYNSENKDCDTLKPNKDKSCHNPLSKSGQNINVCDQQVFKGPSLDKPIKLVANSITSCQPCAIEVDPFTMNLLIQSIIKDIIPEYKEIKDNIEHYTEICKINENTSSKNYQLVSKRAKYCIKNKCYGTLEDYLIDYPKTEEGKKLLNENLYSGEITKFVKQIEKWLKTIFDTLDKLYNIIQFHHCDPKAAQILLVGNEEVSHAIVADLDKVTFTLKINGTYYRILLTMPVGGETGLAVANFFSLRGTVNKQFHASNYMRREFKPRKNCQYEKFGFLASICLLCPTLYIANKVKKVGEQLIKNSQYKLKEFTELLFSPELLNKKRTLSYPLGFIIETKKYEFEKLKSVVQLNTVPKLSINVS